MVLDIITIISLQFLFSVIISIFGFINLSIIPKVKEKFKALTIINKIITSYLFGIGMYIFLSYIFVTIYVYDIFTGYFLYVMIDIVGLLYLIRLNSNNIFNSIKNKLYSKEAIEQDSSTKPLSLSSYFQKVWGFGKTYFADNKQFIIFTLVLIFYLWFIFYNKWYVLLSSTSSHIALDPYKWEADLYYLLHYNDLNYFYNLYSYPAGFLFYNAAILRIYPFVILEDVHYYIQFFPMILYFENHILMFLIGFKLFYRKKDNLSSFFALFIIATFLSYYSYYIYRSLLFVPTILISNLTILLIYFIICQGINKYLKYLIEGIVLSSMILIHPLYGLINVMIYFVFQLIYITFYENSFSKKTFINDLKKWVINLIKSNILQVSLIVIFLFLFAINLVVRFKYNWANPNSYFRFFNAIYIQIIYFVYKLIYEFLVKIPINPFVPFMGGGLFIPQSLVDIDVFTKLNQLISNTLFNFFFVFLVVLIWPISKKFDSRKEIGRGISYLKIGSFLTILFFVYSPIIIRRSYWELFYSRMAELFALYSLPILSIGLFYSIHLIKNLFFIFKNKVELFKLKRKNHNTKNRENKKISRSIKQYNNITNNGLKAIVIIWVIFISLIAIKGEIITQPGSIHFFLNDNYDDFLFSFRNIEDNYFSTSPNSEKRIVYFQADNNKMFLILKNFFRWDHIIYSANFSYTNESFYNFYNNNISINEIIITTSEYPVFHSIINSYGNYSRLLYKNSEIIALEKTENISSVTILEN